MYSNRNKSTNGKEEDEFFYSQFEKYIPIEIGNFDGKKLPYTTYIPPFPNTTNFKIKNAFYKQKRFDLSKIEIFESYVFLQNLGKSIRNSRFSISKR